MATTTATPATTITSHTWTRTKGPWAGEEVTTELAHANPDCPRAAEGTFVRTTDESPYAVAWSCGTCTAVPGEADEVGFSDRDLAASNAAAPSVDAPDRSGAGAGSGPGAANKATDRQVAFARTLASERGITGEALDAKVAEWADLSKGRMSKVIDALLATPKVEAPAEGRPANVRPNRYEGTCPDCGSTVPAEAGSLTKEGGRWVTRHLPGACPAPASPAPAPATSKAAADLPDVPAGHYAIASEGDNDLLFVRVDRPDSGAYAGATFVKMVVGGRPDMNLPRKQVPGVLARILDAGVDAAGARYGQEIGRCCRCNRTLTDEASRAAGIGPDCASRS